VSERCIVAVRFTPAGTLGQLRKAVGGFLRYVQHRDLHPEQATSARPEVAGLLKYVAYRDRASARAELFGPEGTMSSAERKAFAAFVLRSLEESRPQLYRNRDGEQVDRRRAVYRLVISPERAEGLDLRQLTAAAVAAMESELGGDRLRWMAAIHRNTAHPHVHLVVAGMRETEQGFRCFDLTKPRLAAMKAAVAEEIVRQRAERQPAVLAERAPVTAPSDARDTTPGRLTAPTTPRPLPSVLSTPSPMPLRSLRVRHRHPRPTKTSVPMLRLRAAARRYAWQVANDAAREAREHGWEHAA
jgi:hypothetical protein